MVPEILVIVELLIYSLEDNKFVMYWQKDYVYKDCSLRMGSKKMADLLYAIIMTNSHIVGSYGTGIYEYTRKQNCYNFVELKIFIHPSMIQKFEELSGIKLKDPIQVSIN